MIRSTEHRRPTDIHVAETSDPWQKPTETGNRSSGQECGNVFAWSPVSNDKYIKPTTHNALFFFLQPGAESLVVDVASSEGRGLVPLHLPLVGRLFPAVPGVVVLLRQPEHCEDPHLPACPSTPPPPAAAAAAARPGLSTHLGQSGRRSSAGLRQKELPAVPEASRKRHSAFHLRLRLLLPLHLHVRESQPPLPGHRVPHRTATPHQDLLAGELDHTGWRHVQVQLQLVWSFWLQTFSNSGLVFKKWNSH